MTHSLRDKEVRPWKQRKGAKGNLGEVAYRVSPTQAEKARDYGSMIKDFKFLLSIQKFRDHDLQGPWNFQQTKQVLSVIRTGPGARQIWGMVEEAN